MVLQLTTKSRVALLLEVCVSASRLGKTLMFPRPLRWTLELYLRIAFGSAGRKRTRVVMIDCAALCAVVFAAFVKTWPNVVQGYQDYYD